MDSTGVEIGSFVELDGLIGVVVSVPNETAAIAEDHVAVWFGLETQKRTSEGGKGNTVPEVWIVPVDVCKPAHSPVYRH
jgi:hypothetical protein